MFFSRKSGIVASRIAASRIPTPVLLLSGLLFSGLLMAGTAMPLRAAEHITLRNGFDLICDHREVSGDHVRLYLSATGSDFTEV
ncbi:MAG TPA: hypothetical protein VH139_08070, partial [Acidobacteriaceae bacterium]|nr:hypothetical protein [Acidobacteriaceae bacterium]